VNALIRDSIAKICPLSRVFLGITLLLTAALNSLFYIAVIQLSVSISLLIIITSGGEVFRKSSLLLGWLVIPILILHALFTPGELLVKQAAVSVSVEGLQLGGWFAFHLIVIFFTALVFSRLLNREEWINLILRMPQWGERAIPYLLLLETGLKKNRNVVKQECDNWCSSGKKLSRLPIHITTALTETLNENKKDAYELWQNWDHRVASITEDSNSAMQIEPIPTAVAVIATIVVWVIYLTGGM